MNNNYSSQTNSNQILNEITKTILSKVNDAYITSENESSEKYITKSKLIESAVDMSAQEKIDALDKNYNQRKHEHYDNFFSYSISSLCAVSITTVGPAVISKIIHLAA